MTGRDEAADGDGGPEARAARVLEDLRVLARQAAERSGLAPSERSPIEALVVPVVVSMERSPAAGRGPEAARLVADLAARIDEALRGAGAFRPGRVHCFQCGTAECAHAVPGSPTETFGGYGPSGKPDWIEFANLLLERKDPRVDRLYGDAPQVVAVAMAGRDLHGRLLGALRRDRSFAVLGQVAAGLVPGGLGGGRAGDDERVTLTLQVVETRFAGGGRRLRLNVLGTTLDAVSGAAEGGRGRGAAERLRRLIVATRQRLDLLGRAAAAGERRGRPLDLPAEVEPLLAHVRGEVERVFRDAGRRTRHATERHLDGGRPTDTAQADAARAPLERLLFDEQRNTVVVLGPRGRAHVFSPDGRHVTSLALGPSEAERKGGRSRWRPLTRLEADAFRRALAERS